MDKEEVIRLTALDRALTAYQHGLWSVDTKLEDVIRSAKTLEAYLKGEDTAKKDPA